MKKNILAMTLCCACVLSGCARLDSGSYSTVRPHVQAQTTAPQTMTAKNRQELLTHIEKLISGAKEEGVIYVDGYDQDRIQEEMTQICRQIKDNSSVAAYALDGISFELGKSDGRPALSLMIRYARNPADILSIRTVSDMDMAADQIRNAMARCDAGLVLRINHYQETDLLQVVKDYAMDNPHLVMEMPQLSWSTYPKQGEDRVLELSFLYQTDRDLLKSMQTKVEPVFASAVLYVSGDAGEHEKFSQLYSFLMERYEYSFESSVTPAYSLLRQGVGDSYAFSMVYAAMCRQADLECMIVSGTKDGESRYWNIVRRDESYYHVDLLSGSYCELRDWQMDGYVWDRSAYPACQRNKS